MTVDPAEQPTTLRQTVHFSGQVQGVGFRFTTERIATNYPVTGFVHNLPNGQVEMVAEGVADQLDQFLLAIKREMAGHIQDVQVVDSVATGQFTVFRITY